MTEWRAYYDDYGETAIPELGVPGRPGTMLVAPVPFDGDRILVDGLTLEAAEKVVAALNDAARALAEIETALTELRKRVLPQVQRAKKDKAPGRTEFWCGLRNLIDAALEETKP